jgi:hypothetical protein
MQILALVVACSTVVLGFVLAARLLRLAARSHKAPELAMGVYCLLVTIGAVLYFYCLAANARSAQLPAWVLWLSDVSTLLVGLAAFALAVGIWQIFHAGRRWAVVAVVGVGLWIAVGWIASVSPGRLVRLGDFTAANAFFLAGRVAVYGFGAFEAFRYARKLRRRAALGLGDPVAAHQIGLWGGAWVCVALVGVCSFAITGLVGPEAFEHSLAPLLVSGLNAAAWVCTWLSFFPPAAYQRWVARGASEVPA